MRPDEPREAPARVLAGEDPTGLQPSAVCGVGSGGLGLMLGQTVKGQAFWGAVSPTGEKGPGEKKQRPAFKVDCKVERPKAP